MSASSDASGVLIELAIEPGSTDHLEVRLRADTRPFGRPVLIGRVPVSDPGEGSLSAVAGGELVADGGIVSLLLRPRDAELVASMVLEASRRALALT